MKKYNFFLLIIFLIFLLNLIFFNFSYATLYIVTDQEGNNICITNQENLISKYKTLGYIISIVQGSNSSQESSESQTISEPESEPKPKTEPQSDPEKEKLKKEIEAQLKAKIKELENQPKADIVFIDSTNRLSDSGSYYYVEGILKNKGKGIAYHVEVEIRSLDKYNNLVSIDNGYTNPTTITPTQEATYQIMVSYNSKIAKFDKTVHWSNVY